MMTRLLAAIILSSSFAVAASAKYVKEEWPDLPDSTRQWFKSLRSKHGVPCCEVADGHRTTWRGGKDGGYEVTIEGMWRPVPPEALITDAGNPVGETIVWYTLQGSNIYYIRCLVLGPGG